MNYKFDEVLLIFEETLDVLKKQASIAKVYDNLTKIVNVNLQKVRQVWGVEIVSWACSGAIMGEKMIND